MRNWWKYGWVLRVIDGDTFWLWDGELPEKIRLHNVWAPEINESGGYAAANELFRLLSLDRHQVLCRCIDIDRFGRYVCQVFATYSDRRGQRWWFDVNGHIMSFIVRYKAAVASMIRRPPP
jgi:endonuclease YncB( thermonuclease family)